MNAVDIAVIVVVLASGVFALMRGLIHEILAVTGWVAAGLAAFWGLPLVRPLIRNYIAGQTLGDIVGGALIFLVVLLLSSALTHAVARRVQRSAIGSVDRSLGFAFGLARGVVLASLCFILVTKLMAPLEPEILSNAKTRPLMAAGARMIQSLIPAQFQAVEDRAKGAGQLLDDARQAQDMYERLQAPKPRAGEAGAAKPASPPEYDSRGLERLIETTK